MSSTVESLGSERNSIEDKPWLLLKQCWPEMTQHPWILSYLALIKWEFPQGQNLSLQGFGFLKYDQLGCSSDTGSPSSAKIYIYNQPDDLFISSSSHPEFLHPSLTILCPPIPGFQLRSSTPSPSSLALKCIKNSSWSSKTNRNGCDMLKFACGIYQSVDYYDIIKPIGKANWRSATSCAQEDWEREWQWSETIEHEFSHRRCRGREIDCVEDVLTSNIIRLIDVFWTTCTSTSHWVHGGWRLAWLLRVRGF